VIIDLLWGNGTIQPFFSGSAVPAISVVPSSSLTFIAGEARTTSDKNPEHWPSIRQSLRRRRETTPKIRSTGKEAGRQKQQSCDVQECSERLWTARDLVRIYPGGRRDSVAEEN